MDKILYRPGITSELARIFNVTPKTVRNALGGVYNSNLALRIRNAAIKKGCVVMNGGGAL